MAAEIWDSLRFLLRRGDDVLKNFTLEEKVDLLGRMVANLIDEVEILRDYARRTSPLSPEAWDAEYRKHRMWLLFSGQGAPPACVRKFLPYVQAPSETAAELIPDEAQREQEISDLGMLT
jgi:hypothetical protein